MKLMELQKTEIQSSKEIAKELRDAFLESNTAVVSPALNLLKKLPESKKFHDLGHTYDVVEGIMILWAKEHNIPLRDVLNSGNQDLHELLVAGVYHDTGQLEGAKDHEIRSANFMKQSLADFYDQASLDRISGRIMATRMELTSDGKFCQVPAKDKFDTIIQDADMFNLGSTDFKKQYDISCSLFTEVIGTVDGIAYDNSADFIEGQIKFFRAHEYRRESGRKLLNPGKATNLKCLELESLRNMLTLATI